MALKSRNRSVRQLLPLASTLLLAALLAIASSGIVLVQDPGLTLVNEDREVVERKKEGQFIARPVFNRELDVLYYAVRDADTGDWLTLMYRVQGGEKKLSDGWEYSWEYPALSEQPDLDSERAYLLVIGVPADALGGPYVFHALIPVHQPSGLWDRILGALDPGRWARAFARWVIEGVHGGLCAVVERATRTEIDNCG